MTVSEIRDLAGRLKQNMEKHIFGKGDVLEKMIICLFCGGHILLEDIPGTGKTTLAKALAGSIGCDFKRVQFTPDLLPSDITGINFFSQKESEFVFKKGSVFTNILLGDEINRATPKTQSSLLECMEERQVSADGETYPLSPPFLVIATQNPIEIQGTFPLPEAQLDRFFMQLSMGYPDSENEAVMLKSNITSQGRVPLSAVASREEVIAAISSVGEISVSDDVVAYIVRIVETTRQDDDIRLGVSPRGSIALMRASQGRAAINARNYVTPEDVKAVAADVLAHRIITKGFTLSRNGNAAREIVENMLKIVPAPTETTTNNG